MYNGELLIAVSSLFLLVYPLICNGTSKPLIQLAYLLAILLILVDNNFNYLSLVKTGLILLTIPFLGNRKEFKYEFNLLLTFSLLGMLLLVSSTNLLAIYLALELISLCGYLLTTTPSPMDNNSVEAGLKYFVLGSLASGFILFGISLIYGFTGLIDLNDLTNSNLHLTMGALVGSILLISGFLFKLAAVPFHGWVPDVYEGAPTTVMGFFATLPKLVYLIVLIRIVGYQLDTWESLLMMSSMLSMIIGSFGALYQTTIKRFLAYSTISNVGFILMGLASGTIEGIEAAVFYTLIYMVTNLGIFMVILSIKNKYIAEFKSLSKSNNKLAIGLTLLLFSTAGLPPLAGFLGKLSLFIGAIDESMYLLVVVAIFTSVLSAAYYVRIIQHMFFSSKNVDDAEVISLKGINGIALSISIAFITLLILQPNWLLVLSHQIVLELV